jgi:hypothetical protein
VDLASASSDAPGTSGQGDHPNIASSAAGPFDLKDPVFRLGEADAGNAAFCEAP